MLFPRVELPLYMHLTGTYYTGKVLVMDTTDLNITDSVPAGFLVGEDDLPQLIIDGDPVEVKSAVWADDDADAVIVKGYSHETGDSVTYTLFADDEYDVWSV